MVDGLFLTEATKVTSVVAILGLCVSVRVVDALLDQHTERVGVAHRDRLGDLGSPLGTARGHVRAVDGPVRDVVRQERTCTSELFT